MSLPRVYRWINLDRKQHFILMDMEQNNDVLRQLNMFVRSFTPQDKRSPVLARLSQNISMTLWNINGKRDQITYDMWKDMLPKFWKLMFKYWFAEGYLTYLTELAINQNVMNDDVV